MSWIPSAFAKLMDKQYIVNRFVEIDRWSGLHLLSGLLLGLISQKISKKLWIRVLFVFVVMVVYELWENRFWYLFYVRESIANVVWDIIIGLIGVGIIEVIRWQRKNIR